MVSLITVRLGIIRTPLISHFRSSFGHPQLTTNIKCPLNLSPFQIRRKNFEYFWSNYPGLTTQTVLKE